MKKLRAIIYLMILVVCASCSTFYKIDPIDLSEVVINLDLSKGHYKFVDIALLQGPTNFYNWPYKGRIRTWLSELHNPIGKAESAGKKKAKATFEKVPYAPRYPDNAGSRPLIGLYAQGECEKVWIIYFDNQNYLQYYVYDRARDTLLQEANPELAQDISGAVSEKPSTLEPRRGPTLSIDLKLNWKEVETCNKKLVPAKSRTTNCLIDGHKPNLVGSPICE